MSTSFLYYKNNKNLNYYSSNPDTNSIFQYEGFINMVSSDDNPDSMFVCEEWFVNKINVTDGILSIIVY
jgi:hypothetical protein